MTAPFESLTPHEIFTATKWSSRQNAIRHFAAFLESCEAGDSPANRLSAPLLIAVKEHTRGFKETNVNVTKAIIELFLAVCDYHLKCNSPLAESDMRDCVTLAVDKIADRKLSGLAKSLLTNVCLVSRPLAVVNTISSKVDKIKSPLPHEECQNWFKSFCNDFGATSLGNGIKDVVPWLLKVRPPVLFSTGTAVCPRP